MSDGAPAANGQSIIFEGWPCFMVPGHHLVLSPLTSPHSLVICVAGKHFLSFTVNYSP